MSDGALSGGEHGSALTRSIRVVALFVAALRLGTVVQMAPSAVIAVDVSPRPTLCLVTWAGACAMSVAAAWACLARGRLPGGAWMLTDVTAAILLVLAGTFTVPSELRLGSWVGFQPGYVLAVACSLVVVRRPVRWAAAVAVLVVALIHYLQPIFASHPADVAAAIGNVMTLLVISALCWAGAGAVWGLARTADEARAEAVRAVRDTEAQRGRAAVHNAAAMLRLLLELDRSPNAASRAARVQLEAQATDELTRIRAYLRDRPEGHDVGPASYDDLAAVVTDVAAEFADLGIATQVDLARGVALGPGVGADLAVALRSLLLNVRRHARATQVVLYAEAGSPPGSWRLTLHDDGVGFDPSTVARGSGLADAVVGQLARRGIDVEIDSLPGVGTTITTRWRAEVGASRC